MFLCPRLQEFGLPWYSNACCPSLEDESAIYPTSFGVILLTLVKSQNVTSARQYVGFLPQIDAMYRYLCTDTHSPASSDCLPTMNCIAPAVYIL